MLYILLSTSIFLTYGTICVISLIFTFSLETYNMIDEKLNLEIFSSHIVTILDTNINFMEVWIMNHNRVVGPLLTILSLIDLKLFFDIIRNV